jgi:hypothetical protein
MNKKAEFSGKIIGLALGLLLIVGLAAAQRRVQKPAEPVKIQRFSISMNGFGMLEGHRRLMDLKTELQYGIGRSFRLGLGLGYLSEAEGRGDDRGRYDERPGRQSGIQGWNVPMMKGSDLNRDFSVIPVTLNAYYILPVGGKWNLFMSGGGSYHFASLRGPAETQRKRAWGGQGGLGVEFRLSPKIQVAAEGGYRFVRFHGFETPPVYPTILLDGGLNDVAGLWENWIRRGGNALLNRFFAPGPPRRFDINLNGFSCRVGLKFGI